VLDGAATDAAAIPLNNDGATHDVRIVLGDAHAPVRRLLDSRRQQAVSTIEHDNLGR
jgi:hypothetical protein